MIYSMLLSRLLKSQWYALLHDGILLDHIIQYVL